MPILIQILLSVLIIFLGAETRLYLDAVYGGNHTLWVFMVQVVILYFVWIPEYKKKDN